MTVDAFLAKFTTVILEPVSLLLFGIAFVIFIWGIVEFIRDAEGDEGREKGKKNIIWGIVGMVIMISVYGIINIVVGTIGAQGDLPPNAESGPYLLNGGSVESPL